MPGWAALGVGLLLPAMFWVCRWQGWPFWLCGLILLPLAWPRRASGGGAQMASVMPGVAKWLPGLMAALIGVMALAFRNNLSLQYYSVLSSVFFLAVFSGSLLQEQSLVERLARRMDMDFPESAVRYTRRVTQAWCLFFLLNIVLTLLSIRAGEEMWALYSGLISYILMGCMFAGEWVIRRGVIRRARLAEEQAPQREGPHA
jgi:uncharacterized membrane protein